MPNAARYPCSVPRCPNLKPCAVHMKQRRQESESRRATASERGYDWTWHKARTAFLQEHTICYICMQRDGAVTAASVVDHIVPHKGNRQLFWDTENWQSLCATCHNRKTAKEDGGFGH